MKNIAPSIQSNKVHSKYKDLEEYLDIQFRLLREDFIAPLREVISTCCKDELKQSIEIGAYKVNESCTGQSVKVLDRVSWGFVKDTLLNDSQLKALKHCLTRELAIVQGPPGTGKTFLAIKLAEILLANRNVWSNNEGHGTLLIICQTNHGLDQFLEGILKFNDNIVRIGRRCRSKILENKLLDQIMSGEEFKDMSSEKMKEIEHLQDIKKYTKEGVISIETFVEFGIITKDIASSINDCGGIWNLLNIKSPKEVVEKTKAEVTNEINQLKKKKRKRKKGKMKQIEVNIEIKVMRRRQLGEEKVVNMIDMTAKSREEYVEEVLKPLCLTDNSSYEDSLAGWSSLKELCKTHPMSEYYINIFATTVERKDNNNNQTKINKPKKGQKGNKEDSETVVDEAKIGKIKPNVSLSIGEIYERLNPNVKHELSLANQDITTTNEAVGPLSMSKSQRWCFYRSAMDRLQTEIAIKTEKCTNELNKILEQKKLHASISEQEVLESAEVIGMTTTGAAQFTSKLEKVFIPIVIVEEASEVLEAHIISGSTSDIDLKLKLKCMQNDACLTGNPSAFYVIQLITKIRRIRLDETGTLHQQLKFAEISLILGQFEQICQVDDCFSLTYKCTLPDSGSVNYKDLALNKDVKHLIMIGDHKQLRPSPASFKMADKHRLDISLFERMILNGLEYDQLLIQRRMRPEISQLIHPHIYKNLKNDLSVMGYPNVRGVGKDVFFVNHSFQEEKLNDNPSKINLYEAEMVLELGRYLILQDYSPDRITILTTYNAQLAHLRARISDCEKFHCLRDVKVCVVDNYQGEENDIILLTLVRSNKNKSIGFLKIENRVCVALSRAKIGFYCFGNFDLFCQISPLWKGIIETLKESSFYGEELPLYCQHHFAKFIHVKYVHDFNLAPEGGCERWCNYVLNCDHSCTLHCHNFDLSHEKFICRNSCEKPILSCPLHHTCLRTCHFGEECGSCRTIVEKKLPDCEHNRRMQCCENPEDFNCLIYVIKGIPTCGHNGEMQCYVDPEDFNCPIDVTKVIPKCGHNGQMKCYVDPEDFDCPISVYRKMPSCSHIQNMLCYKDLKNVVCESICENKLACGHCCENKCGVKCTDNCSVTVLSECGQKHKISKKCSALEYNPCKAVIEKSIPLCGHIQKVPCHMPPEDFSCIKECEKTLKCGHLCSNLCGQDCVTSCSTEVLSECGQKHEISKKCSALEYSPCKTVVEKSIPLCGHIQKVPCHMPPEDFSCIKECEKTLKCGHQCSHLCGQECVTSCSAEMQVKSDCAHLVKIKCTESVNPNDLWKKCTAKCQEVLPCGHPCPDDCCVSTGQNRKPMSAWVLDKMENPENLLTTISRRKMSFVGHIFRSNDIGKDLLMGTVYGNRGRDNKTRYSDNIKEIGGGRSFVALCRMAQDRVSWKATVVQFESIVR
ncbi:NFX1-type zinc finger-containing protein 1 [Nymphon striatum]|nr:NFX1-type zinc finger-containing protein 1 [Nymphon striatum]